MSNERFAANAATGNHAERSLMMPLEQSYPFIG